MRKIDVQAAARRLQRRGLGLVRARTAAAANLEPLRPAPASWVATCSAARGRYGDEPGCQGQRRWWRERVIVSAMAPRSGARAAPTSAKGQGRVRQPVAARRRRSRPQRILVVRCVRHASGTRVHREGLTCGTSNNGLRGTSSQAVAVGSGGTDLLIDLHRRHRSNSSSSSSFNSHTNHSGASCSSRTSTCQPDLVVVAAAVGSRRHQQRRWRLRLLSQVLVPSGAGPAGAVFALVAVYGLLADAVRAAAVCSHTFCAPVQW